MARRQHHGRHARRRHLHRVERLRRSDRADEDRADARRMAVLRSGRDGGAANPPTWPHWCPPPHRPPVAAAVRRRRATGRPARDHRDRREAGRRALSSDTGAGSYDSLLVEFRDHVMLLEAGQSEARSLAYIAETRSSSRTSRSVRLEFASAFGPHRWPAARTWRRARRSSRRRTTRSSSSGRSTPRGRCSATRSRRPRS